MITTDEILDAVVGAVQSLFPDEEVYPGLAPEDGTRPYHVAALEHITLGTVSHGVAEILYTYKITDLMTVDAQHAGNKTVLDARTLMVVGIFAKGYLPIEDRCAKVRSCVTKHDQDFTETTVVLSLTYDPAEFNPAEVGPLMETLSINTNL